MKKDSIIVHLGLMLLAGIMLFVLLTWILSAYTRHGEEVIIPEIRGKHLTEAIDMLDREDIDYEVVDSIYDAEAMPGAVKESVPSPGARVKPGRTIYLITYAASPRPVVLPYVENMSARQARALLAAMGFDAVTIRIVAGEYRDLCVGVTDLKGRPLQAGTQLSKGTPLVLLISGQVQDTIRVEDLIESTEGEWLGEEQGATRPADSTRRREPKPQAQTGSEPEEWW